jgi:hypothetical protein
MQQPGVDGSLDGNQILRRDKGNNGFGWHNEGGVVASKFKWQAVHRPYRWQSPAMDVL